MTKDTSPDSTTRTVGRGFLFILAAKAYFLITGFAVQFGLPRLFMRAAARIAESGVAAARMAQGLYGDYGVATRTVSWINNTMVQGTIQAVSKYVAEDAERAASVRATALRVQAVVGSTLALTYFALSGVMAGWLNDPKLADYFRITSVIILAYALYAVFIGYLNGLKRFSWQAGFDMTYSTIKTGLILGLAFMGYGVAEVLGAFSFAAVAIAIIAAAVVGVGRGSTPFDWRVLVKAMAIVVAYYIFFNSLLTADLLVLKGVAGRTPGLDPETAARYASALAGVYTGVLNLSLLPYQGVLAVAFVVFPLISKSTFDQDREATEGYISNTLRYSLIFVALVAVAVASAPAGLLRVLNPSFAVGETALRIYVAGEVFFALFAIANTIIIASGHMGVAAGIAAGVLSLDVVSNLLVVPGYVMVAGDGLDPVGLVAAAAATAPVFLVGFVVSSAYLYKRFGAHIPVLTAIRVPLAGVAVAWAATWLPDGGILGTIGKAVAASLALALLLVALRELGASDLVRLKAVLKRG